MWKGWNSQNLPPALSDSGAFLRSLAKAFIRNQGVLNAAALTYTTLFAVVPMMTVTYSMLAAIPSFEGVSQQLEALVFDNFVPSAGETLRQSLSEFASQARSLTAVGVGFLVVTAYLMLKSIENAFNRIWGVGKPRQGLSSFLLYWAVLSLGPMLLGLGFVLTSYVASLPLISDATEVLGGRQSLLSLLPFVTSSAAFTLLYAAVPNCRVPLHHALVGGILVALLFEAAKRSFTLYVTHFPSYQLIYGAFATVPLFLAWIYISWMIVLLGAELVRGLSTFAPRRGVRNQRPLYWVLAILEQLWMAQQQGTSLSADQLQSRLKGLPADDCTYYLGVLTHEGLVSRSEQGRFLLCRDPATLTLVEICRRLPWPVPDSLEAGNQGWPGRVEEELRALGRVREERLGLSLGALFQHNATGASKEGGNSGGEP